MHQSIHFVKNTKILKNVQNAAVFRQFVCVSIGYINNFWTLTK